MAHEDSAGTGVNRELLKRQVGESGRGQRLDLVAARLFPDYSRARIQAWIRSGHLRIDGRVSSVREKLLGGEWLSLEIDVPPCGEWPAQAMTLDIVHEDPAILVVNKPAGLVVHPGAGNADRTLVNGLLAYCPDLAGVPRAGIVHRLDQYTTGLLVVARTLPAHLALVNMLKARQVSRYYQAVVHGRLAGSGTVDAPIGRHPVRRTRMAVNERAGKSARTHYETLATYGHYSHLALQLDTGRTHQIRVHMAHLGHPLVGDPVYGGKRRQRAPLGDSIAERCVGQFARQALHAGQLAFTHPVTGVEMSWQAPLPDDLAALIGALEAEYK